MMMMVMAIMVDKEIVVLAPSFIAYENALMKRIRIDFQVSNRLCFYLCSSKLGNLANHAIVFECWKVYARLYIIWPSHCFWVSCSM